MKHLLVTLAFLPLLFTPPAQAETINTKVIEAEALQVTAATRATSLEQATLNNDEVLSQIVNFWTEERLLNSLPADFSPSLDLEDTDPQLTDPPTKPTPTPPGHTLPTSSPNKTSPKITKSNGTEVLALPTPPLNRNSIPQQAENLKVENFSPINGKVFFQNQLDKKTYHCSGSAINNPSKNLVITAGHCVHSAKNYWHSHWVFIPEYHNGKAPHGVFPAKTFRTFTDWIDYGESPRGFNSDIAFVNVFPNQRGIKLVHAVGGHGLETGSFPHFYASIFGYPLNLSSGREMWACWGPTSPTFYGKYKFNALYGCKFGGGASGGPWLTKFDNRTGLGYVKGVSSFTPGENNLSYIASPIFDNKVWNLYEQSKHG